MQVPYANKWQKEMNKLRTIAINCDLTEEMKWGRPCFTFLRKNIVLISPLKEHVRSHSSKAVCLRTPSASLKGSESTRRPRDGSSSRPLKRSQPCSLP